MQPTNHIKKPIKTNLPTSLRKAFLPSFLNWFGVYLFILLLFFSCNGTEKFAPESAIGSELEPVINRIDLPYETIENGGSTTITVYASPSEKESQDNRLTYEFFYVRDNGDLNGRVNNLNNIGFFNTKKIDGSFYTKAERSGIKIIVNDFDSKYSKETNVYIERGAVANSEVLFGGYRIYSYFLNRFIAYEKGLAIIPFSSSGETETQIYENYTTGIVQNYTKNDSVCLIDFYTCNPKDVSVQYTFSTTSPSSSVIGINQIETGAIIPGIQDEIPDGDYTPNSGFYLLDNIRRFEYIAGQEMGVVSLSTSLNAGSSTVSTNIPIEIYPNFSEKRLVTDQIIQEEEERYFIENEEEEDTEDS